MEVELNNLSKHFGALRANDNISFTFVSGRIYAVLGENGAGKSTLMKTLSGFQTPTHGQIIIDGKPVQLNTPNDAIANGIGMLYQDPLDFAPLSALENFISGRTGGLLLKRRDALAKFNQHATDLKFDLNPHALIETLTVGERQQLEIVRLVSLGVRFLILDEPTTGISAEQKDSLFTTLKRLANEEDMTVVLVTHKLEDVEALCDELVVLRTGQLVGNEHLPCSTARMVELMFGKRFEKIKPESVTVGEQILAINKLPIHARLFSIPEINLSVSQGEVIGLAGLDGSGQVEFMREVAGLDRATWADHVMAVVVFVGIWLLSGELLDESGTVMWLIRLTTAILVLSPMAILLWQRYNQRGDTTQTSSIRLNGAFVGWRGYRDLLGKGVAYLSSGRTEEGLVGGLTITDHVALTTKPARPPTTDIRHMASSMAATIYVNWIQAWKQAKVHIERFNIIGRPFDPVQNLSGGNQQRVAVSLLPANLSLILLEYPTRGLDVESARLIWDTILKRREQGTSIIFSSPDLDEIIDYSDRILVFSSGRVTLVEDASQMTTARLGELIGGKS
jgi:simple sugar transport system ATP-binding protein